MELQCRRQTVKTGRWINKIRLILDLEGVSLFAIKGFLAYAKIITEMDSTYYTGLMLSTHAINVPSSLSWAYALIKPFLSVGVKSKIQIYTGRSTYEQVLLDIIPKHSLPIIYGGTLDWDPPIGDRVDWKAHDARTRQTARKRFKCESTPRAGTNGLQKVVMKAKSTHVVRLEVVPGSEIRYFFETSSTAILFEAQIIEPVSKEAKSQKGKTARFAVDPVQVESSDVPWLSNVIMFEKATVQLKWTNNIGFLKTKDQTLTLGVDVVQHHAPESDGKLGHVSLT